MCDTWVIIVGFVYVATAMGMSLRAFLDRVERPSGLFWQFNKASYTDVGWKWHKRSMWMVAGLLPLLGLLTLVAHFSCRS